MDIQKFIDQTGLVQALQDAIVTNYSDANPDSGGTYQHLIGTVMIAFNGPVVILGETQEQIMAPMCGGRRGGVLFVPMQGFTRIDGETTLGKGILEAADERDILGFEMKEGRFQDSTFPSMKNFFSITRSLPSEVNDLRANEYLACTVSALARLNDDYNFLPEGTTINELPFSYTEKLGKADWHQFSPGLQRAIKLAMSKNAHPASKGTGKPSALDQAKSLVEASKADKAKGGVLSANDLAKFGEITTKFITKYFLGGLGRGTGNDSDSEQFYAAGTEWTIIAQETDSNSINIAVRDYKSTIFAISSLDSGRLALQSDAFRERHSNSKTVTLGLRGGRPVFRTKSGPMEVKDFHNEAKNVHDRNGIMVAVTVMKAYRDAISKGIAEESGASDDGLDELTTEKVRAAVNQLFYEYWAGNLEGGKSAMVPVIGKLSLKGSNADPDFTDSNEDELRITLMASKTEIFHIEDSGHGDWGNSNRSPLSKFIDETEYRCMYVDNAGAFYIGEDLGTPARIPLDDLLKVHSSSKSAQQLIKVAVEVVRCYTELHNGQGTAGAVADPITKDSLAEEEGQTIPDPVTKESLAAEGEAEGQTIPDPVTKESLAAESEASDNIVSRIVDAMNAKWRDAKSMTVTQGKMKWRIMLTLSEDKKMVTKSRVNVYRGSEQVALGTGFPKGFRTKEGGDVFYTLTDYGTEEGGDVMRRSTKASLKGIADQISSRKVETMPGIDSLIVFAYADFLFRQQNGMLDEARTSSSSARRQPGQGEGLDFNSLLEAMGESAEKAQLSKTAAYGSIRAGGKYRIKWKAMPESLSTEIRINEIPKQRASIRNGIMTAQLEGRQGRTRIADAVEGTVNHKAIGVHTGNLERACEAVLKKVEDGSATAQQLLAVVARAAQMSGGY